MTKKEFNELPPSEIYRIMKDGFHYKAIGVKIQEGGYLVWTYKSGEGVPMLDFFAPYIGKPLDFFLQQLYYYE